MEKQEQVHLTARSGELNVVDAAGEAMIGALQLSDTEVQAFGVGSMGPRDILIMLESISDAAYTMLTELGISEQQAGLMIGAAILKTLAPEVEQKKSSLIVP